MKSLCCSIAVVALVCTNAVAQPAPPSEYERAFVAGRALYDAGQWARARAKFLEAYRIHREPLLAFNIGSTYRREGDVERALHYYRKFLELAAPDDEYRALAQSVIVELEASHREPPDPPLPTPPPAPPDAVEARVVAETEAEARPGRALRIGGVVTMIAGAVVLGVSVERGLQARSIEADLEQSGGEWTPARERALADGDRARDHSIAAGILGVAAVGTGAVLYYYGLRGEREATRPAISVTASPERIGLAITGRF